MKITTNDKALVEKLVNKWDVTGLLQELDKSKIEKVALLLEGQAKHLISYADYFKKYYSESVRNDALDIMLPLVRRLFGSDMLKFDFDVATTPVFYYTDDSDKECRAVVSTTKLKTRFDYDAYNTLKVGAELMNHPDPLLEMTEITTKALADEFNERFNNVSSVVFHTPINLMGALHKTGDASSTNIVVCFASRYKRFDK